MKHLISTAIITLSITTASTVANANEAIENLKLIAENNTAAMHLHFGYDRTAKNMKRVYRTAEKYINMYGSNCPGHSKYVCKKALENILWSREKSVHSYYNCLVKTRRGNDLDFRECTYNFHTQALLTLLMFQ